MKKPMDGAVALPDLDPFLLDSQLALRPAHIMEDYRRDQLDAHANLIQ